MTNDKVLTWLKELLDMGNDFEQGSENFESTWEIPFDQAFNQWKARCMAFADSVFGRGTPYFEQMQNAFNHERPELAVQGVLNAARQDIKRGYLTKVETLVAADVFTDFLDMAEHLIEQGYKDPAAMLVGAVLEIGLKTIATNNGIEVSSSDDMGAVNQKLANKGVYNRIVQKQVQVWNDIRNKADHGEFSQYTLDMVREELNGVRGFLGQYLV